VLVVDDDVDDDVHVFSCISRPSLGRGFDGIGGGKEEYILNVPPRIVIVVVVIAIAINFIG
jgi:hypothetical protein